MIRFFKITWRSEYKQCIQSVLGHLMFKTLDRPVASTRLSKFHPLDSRQFVVHSPDVHSNMIVLLIIYYYLPVRPVSFSTVNLFRNSL